ncbi:hypothetical protein L6452_36930 [Arctium lappa]|uniref:Uncharacterized protein n=1 Tax=Arctium lappa TaxID=4217 RepID=A0ACB8Y1H1_ARCLA|nr:hypothetical protein L6452_36930 [Arctium lappa]
MSHKRLMFLRWVSHRRQHKSPRVCQVAPAAWKSDFSSNLAVVTRYTALLVAFRVLPNMYYNQEFICLISQGFSLLTANNRVTTFENISGTR